MLFIVTEYFYFTIRLFRVIFDFCPIKKKGALLCWPIVWDRHVIFDHVWETD